MRTALLLYISVLALSFDAIAQQPAQSSPQNIESLMAEKIRMLKNGALLVRLQTKENSINALRDAGNQETADKVEKQQQQFNKNLIAAFRNKYDFSPVYFFTSNYSEALLSGNLDKVVFVNDSVLPDPSIRITQTGFLIAEAGALEPDTAAYFEDQYYDYSSNLAKKESYYGSSNMGIDAIRIMNNKFVQLKGPFPYYVRLYSSLPVERDLQKAVEKLNKKLSAYYEQKKEK
jgi:hypothetical protein